jgi:CHAT domain-containing protein/Tfp pilus assembly protein PilF
MESGLGAEEQKELYESGEVVADTRTPSQSIQHNAHFAQSNQLPFPHATQPNQSESEEVQPRDLEVFRAPFSSAKQHWVESKFSVYQTISISKLNENSEQWVESHLSFEGIQQTTLILDGDQTVFDVEMSSSSPQDSSKNIEIFTPKTQEYTQISQASTPSINVSLDAGNRKLDEQKYDEAAISFDEALRQAEFTRDQIGITQALSGKTAVALRLKQYVDAQNLAEQALVTLRKAGKKFPTLEVDLLLRQGYAYLGQEKLLDLEAVLKQVTSLVPKLEPSEESAGLLVSLADLQYAVGNKESGNQSVQKAVGFLQKNPDPSGAIAVLSRLAVSQSTSGNSDGTVKTLDRMTELIEQLKEQPKKIALLQSVGGLYLKLGGSEDLKTGQSERARQLFEKARQSFEKAGWLYNPQDNKTEENVQILLGLGKAYLGLNRTEEAVEQAQQAIDIINELEKISGVQEAEKKPRPFFQQLGCGIERLFSRSSECDDEDAELDALNQADTVLKRMKRDARNIIAAARLEQERYAESSANLRDALQITREIDGELSNFSRTIRQIQGISGIIAVLPLGFVSEVGSYINTTAAGLDQMLALPQGGLSLLEKINADMIGRSKRRSLDDLKKEQEAARSQKDANKEAEILLQLGSGYLGVGKYGDAGNAFKEAAKLFRGLNQSGEPIQEGQKTWTAKEAEALLGSGRSLSLERNYQAAQTIAQQALDIFQKEGDTLGSANAWLTLGNIHLAQSRLLQAKEQLQKAQDIFSKTQDDKDAQIGNANALLALGTVALRQRKYQLALQQTEEAIGIFQILQNELESARARLVRGSAYQALGDHKRALEDAQKALFVFKDLGDRAGEISALNNIGDVLQSQKQYEQAIKFYGLSAELQKDLQKNIQKPKPKTGVLVNIFRVGSFFMPWIGALGNVGFKVYNALSIAQSVVYLSETATSSLGAGISYLSLGDYDQAMAAFDQVRKDSENKDPQKEAEALLGLSNTRLSFDRNYDMARKDAEKAAKLFDSIGDRAGAASAMLAQGISYDRLGKAQSDPKKQSAFFGQSFVEIQKALSTFQDPEIADPAGIAQAYSALADLLVNKGQKNAAIIFYKKSIEVTEEIRRSIPEGELRTTYVGKVVETYRRLIGLLLSQARVPEAQQVLELLKAQEIREYTGITRASIGDDNKIVYAEGIEKEIAQKYDGKIIALGLQLANCKQNCQALEDQRDQLVTQFDKLVEPINQIISARTLGQDPLIYNPNSLSSSAKKIVQPCENFKQTCPKPVQELNTMLVYPFVAEDDEDKTKYKLWLLWASPQGVSLAISRKIDRQLLEQTVFGFYSLVSSPGNLVELQQKSKQLYSWLIQPLEEQLQAGKINNLVFVLDRFLRYVPMAALYDGKEYLIQKGYQVSTIISAKDTDMTDWLSFDAKNIGVLAMGLSEERPDFPALKDVPEELEEVVRRLSSEGKPDSSDKDGVYPGRIFSNQEFDLKALTNGLGKESLQRYRYKILHIATHGKFVPGTDRSSFLVLGTGDKNTLTKLTIPDIDKKLQYGLTNIHLVVLSACQTALGGNTKSREDELDGLEIPGLSYSFIREGRAKSVLASLWLVNSQATTRLMQAFYGNLANSKNPITKAEALRRAQLFILTGKNQYTDENRGFRIELAPGTVAPIADSSHPFFWAPFTLIGNGL